MSEIRVTSVVGENGGDRVGLTTGLTVGPLTGTTGIKGFVVPIPT